MTVLDKTKNVSFINVSEKLRAKGVDNYDFMLRTIDSSLIGIDPYSQSLSVTDMINVGIECRDNPWYFIREVVRVPHIVDAPTAFELTEANLATLWAAFNNINFLSMFPRQTGGTVTNIAYLLWFKLFSGWDQTGRCVGQSTFNRDLLSTKLATMQDGLPSYLKESNPSLGIDLKFLTLPREEISCDQFGKLDLGSVVILSDIAFFPHLDKYYPSILTGRYHTIEHDNRANKPNVVIIDTNQPKRNHKNYEFFEKIKSGCMPFSENFYDIKEISDLKEFIRRFSKQNMLIGKFTPLQAGRDITWGASGAGHCGGDYEFMLREYYHVV